MPFTYSIDPRARMLFVVGEGSVTQAERLAAMRAWLSDHLYEPGFDTLADFSASTSTPGLTELREIVAFIRENAAMIGRKKLAIVTTSSFTYGVARQFQLMAEAGPLEVRVFTDRGSAQAWLAGIV